MILLAEGSTFRLILPSSFRFVAGHLCERNVVTPDNFGDELVGFGFVALVVLNRFGARKLCDEIRIAVLHVPKVMQITVGENYVAATVVTCVLPRLLLADQRIFVFGLCLKHDDWESVFIGEQKIDVAVARGFKVVTQFVNVFVSEFDVPFKRNICATIGVVKKAPTRCF